MTARNLRTLRALHERTGDERFLAPFEAAVEWFERARRDDGSWARFYELGTDRPIYGDRDGEVHYTLEELSQERRDGYAWHGRWPAAGGRTLPGPHA